MIRLLQVTHALYPQASGGVELYTLECARALGGAVFSFTAQPAAAPPQWAGLEVFAPAPGESAARAWRRTLEAVDPEVVLVQHLGSARAELLEVLVERSVPYAVMVHDFTQLCPTHKLWHRRESACYGPGVTGFKCAWCVAGAPRRWIELPARTWRYQHRPAQWRNALARAHALVVETRYLRDFWIEHGAPPERIAVLPVRLPESAPPPPPPPGGATPRSLFYGGGWSVAKGAPLLADALDRLAAPVRLELAGPWSPADLAAMRRLLADRHTLIHHGQLPPEELRVRLRACAAAVVPSRWQEAYGRIATEAQQLGIPVVATAVGGLPERIIHGVNGYLARPDDPDSLAAAIEQAFTAPGWNSEEVIHAATREAAAALVHLRRLVELLAAARAEPQLEPAFELEYGAAAAGPEARARIIAALRACGDEDEAAAHADPDRLRYAWAFTRLRRVHLNHAIAFFRGLDCRHVAVVEDDCGDAAAALLAWGIVPTPETEAEGVFWAAMPGRFPGPAGHWDSWRSRFPRARAAAWTEGFELATASA